MTVGAMESINPSIEQLLRKRGAWFDDHGLPLELARARAAASRAIAERFPAFEALRDQALGRRPRRPCGADAATLARILIAAEVVEDDGDGIAPLNAEARRYLSGGWLEEYAGLAAEAAGADDVRIGQRVAWRAKGFDGVNEIDVIARFGARLLFISAKGLRSRLDPEDDLHRERLMDALHEADNLVDHFSDGDAAVLLLVTTDLFDERARVPRYEQLHGKAAALGVGLATLEHLQWNDLVARVGRLANEGSR